MCMGVCQPACMCFVTSKSEAMVFSQNRWSAHSGVGTCFWRNSSIPGSGLSEERGGTSYSDVSLFFKVWKKIRTITVLFELCSNNNHINNVHFIKHIVVLIYATTQQLNFDKWIKNKKYKSFVFTSLKPRACAHVNFLVCFCQ